MERLQVLIERPDADDVPSFNARATESLGKLARQPKISHLALCLAGDDATGRPAFDAVVDAACDDAARELVIDAVADLGAASAYRVELRRMAEYPRSWRDGTRTPGLVMISPSYRAAAMNADEFSHHWLHEHGPLALRHHPGMWDYRQYLVTEVLSPHGAPFDGIAWMGFPDLDAFRTGLFDSPEGRQIIMADTDVFLDLPRSKSAILRETVLKSAG